MIMLVGRKCKTCNKRMSYFGSQTKTKICHVCKQKEWYERQKKKKKGKRSETNN